MPRSNSELTLAERRQRAFELFTRGFNNVEVAGELGVHPETAARYRAEYEDELHATAQANPLILRQVLDNTLRMLEENEQVRKEAWLQYEAAPSGAVKAQMLNVVNKAQEQRAKLLGVLGVKHEYFTMVTKIQQVQGALLEFMKTELCKQDRKKLEELLLRMDADEQGALPVAASVR